MSVKKSLLGLVQDILSGMDSDEVNSIDDTVEASQVAQIVRSTYEAMMSNRNWPHQKRLLTLTPSGDNALPTHVTMQEEVKEMVSVRYNAAKVGQTRLYYQPVRYLEPDDFLRYSNSRNTDADNIDVIYDSVDVPLLIRNDQPPKYFTSFNDNVLIFDSYDKAVDDTLQASKIQAVAYIMLEWSHVDDFIPNLPAEAFTALLEEAKSRCFVELKQQANPVAATEARRQKAWLSRKAWRANGGVKFNSYGRGRVKSERDPTFERDR